MKLTKKLFYHVFTDHKDEYVSTLIEAREIIKKWKKEGYGSWRIYGVWDASTEESEREEYIDGHGHFPA